MSASITADPFAGTQQVSTVNLQIENAVNNSGTTVAVGQVLLFDKAVTHPEGYRSMIVPVTAKLATGEFAIVVGLGNTNTGADGTVIVVQTEGVLPASLAANSGVGAELAAADGVKTLTSTSIGRRRVIGWSRETGTGLKSIYFRGTGNGVVPDGNAD